MEKNQKQEPTGFADMFSPIGIRYLSLMLQSKLFNDQHLFRYLLEEAGPVWVPILCFVTFIPLMPMCLGNYWKYLPLLIAIVLLIVIVVNVIFYILSQTDVCSCCYEKLVKDIGKNNDLQIFVNRYRGCDGRINRLQLWNIYRAFEKDYEEKRKNASINNLFNIN